MSIESELLALKRDEFIHAQDVVTFAKTHPKSELHKQFPWDVEKAANEHWLWVARRLIALHITYEGGERKFISLSIDRSRDGGGYRDMNDVLKDRSLYAIALADALRELERLQERYAHLQALKPIWSAARKIKARTASKQKGGGERQRRVSA